MSVPRLLFVPTHKTGLAYVVASLLAEIAARGGTRVRLHHLGALGPNAVWDRWGGASFLDAGLYDRRVAARLYARAVSGAQLSLLAAGVGLFDDCPSGSWTPAEIARSLDAPVVLVVDCRGWGRSLECLIEGMKAHAARMTVNLAGIVLSGAGDEAHAAQISQRVCGRELPLVGAFLETDALGWDTPAPGVARACDGSELEPWLALLERRVDLDLVEELASQRGYLPEEGPVRGGGGPLVLVASCSGFTPWALDAIDLVRAAGARVRRLDLIEDPVLPDGTAGVVMAGHLWQERMLDLSQNYSLMRDLRVKVEEGLPLLALGGGMTYLLRRVQDSMGRSHDMAGIIPATAEIIADLDDAAFLEVRAEKDTVLLERGETVTGWITQDVELAEAPVSRDYALAVRHREWEASLGEGAAAKRLFCSRVLIHPASCRRGMAKFVASCRDYLSLARAGV